MWNVTNEINRPILERYSLILESFFLILIKISSEKNKTKLLKDDQYLIKIFDEDDLLNSKLLSINRSANDTIVKLIIEIVKLESKQLKEEYKTYKKQNDLIDNRNYNLTIKNHPECLTKLFKDYFYDKFFGVDWIWEELVGKQYNRGMFKSDFLYENRLYACPYCDTDTISNIRNSWIEHFLPKSKFPYVCCNINNLIPSCTSCNVSGSGKGEDYKNPIANQFSTQIGDQIEFEYINGEILIPENENQSIENFIILLKLRKRYKEKNVHSRIISTLKNNYNIVLGLKEMNDFDEDVFNDFIYSNGKNNGIYFVQKSILKYINEI